MTLLQNVEHVLEAMTDLRDLRNRLAAIDEERVIVEQQIRSRLSQIASAAEVVQPVVEAALPPSTPATHPASTGAARPARNSGMTERVLATVQQHAATSSIGALDIGRLWNQTDDSTINSIRAALSRLTSDSKIRKMSYGRYMAAAEGGVTTAA